MAGINLINSLPCGRLDVGFFKQVLRITVSQTSEHFSRERIMFDALEEHNGKVSIGGRNITNLRFADDIGALAEEEQELEALVESLDKTCA